MRPDIARHLPLIAAILWQVAVLFGIRCFAANPSGGDFCQDIVASLRLLAHQNPYAPITSCGILNLTPHPPASLLVTAPFALLPVAWGAALWDVCSLVALGVAVIVITRELGLRLDTWRAAILLALLAVWAPMLSTLLEAQDSLLLLLLVVLAWRDARSGRSGRAGALLGVAAALRLFPALLVVYFALRRDWRAVALAGVAFLGCSLAALPWIGVAGYLDYATHAAPAVGASWIGSNGNASLFGLPYHLLGATPLATLAPLAGRALVAVLLALLLTLTIRRPPAPFARDDTVFLAYIPATLLVSPLMWLHYFVLLLLPLAVLAARLGWLGLPTDPEIGAVHRRRVAIAVAASLALIELFYVLNRVPWPAALGALTGPLVYSLPTYALLALLLALLSGQPRTEPPSPPAEGGPSHRPVGVSSVPPVSRRLWPTPRPFGGAPR
jgi:hypothetical protein